MKFIFHRRGLPLLLSLQAAVSAGPYDASPLRGPLTTEPHFQTSLGREGHRFADAPINKYRLYDFYARQAQYHLSQAKAAQRLLPYPGLEGGRRGHWGVTNEKTSSTELNRSQEPRYLRLIDRGASGNQHVISSHSQSLCLFAKASPSMSKVLLHASIKTPEHPFSHKVDRYGFGLNVKGEEYLKGHPTEWHTTDGKAVPVSNHGYHLHQDNVIFRRHVANTPLLDQVGVSYFGKFPVYHRLLEWQENTTALKFPLPVEASLIQQGRIEIQKQAKGWLATITGNQRRLSHRISCSEESHGITLDCKGGKIWVRFPSVKKGDTIRMDSWISPLHQPSLQTPDAEPRQLSSRTRGGPRYFQQTTTVKGQLNADPAATGSAYEIDDIPVPTHNPYGMPMTTSGLAFSQSGDAYLCTLVGDIWKVTGLDHGLEQVTWQRFASGINSPLGLEMVDGVLHVISQHEILQLMDFNHDGEADFVKPFARIRPRGTGGADNSSDARVQDLCRDARGYFYYGHVSGIHRVSPDGSTVTRISDRVRNPFGLAVRPDGLALSDSSEGNQSNGTCTIYESPHPENQHSAAKARRLLYLPRGIDNSPGSRLFVNSDRFGPLGKSLLGLSYGTGRLYQIMRDPNHGTPQAALRLLPGEFSSGAARLATNPNDGQVYIVGFDGWGDFSITEGCFHRVRYTGKKEPTPVSWNAYHNGLSIHFNQALDPDSLSPGGFFVQQWNYIDSTHTYGSAEYSVKSPGSIGHDRIPVQAVSLSADGKELRLLTPDILPAMCTQVHGQLQSASGRKFTLDLYATLNQLPRQGVQGKPARSGKKLRLEVPFKARNGNTYATLMDFFDRRAGRDTVKRPVGPSVPYQKKDLNYAWIHANIIQKQSCIACHLPGSQHDFSSYEKLLKAIDLNHPDKSHILGMTASGSMPPYPMPTVSPEMQQALKQWIQMGAPKE